MVDHALSARVGPADHQEEPVIRRSAIEQPLGQRLGPELARFGRGRRRIEMGRRIGAVLQYRKRLTAGETHGVRFEHPTPA
jgi:hypothetical protein